MLADVELAIKKYKNTNKTIWVEYTFSTKNRREMIYNFANIIRKELSSDFSINLIWVTSTEEQYLENYRKRFYDIETTRANELALGTFKTFNDTIQTQPPEEDDIDWDSFIIVDNISNTPVKLSYDL